MPQIHVIIIILIIIASSNSSSFFNIVDSAVDVSNGDEIDVVVDGEIDVAESLVGEAETKVEIAFIIFIHATS